MSESIENDQNHSRCDIPNYGYKKSGTGQNWKVNHLGLSRWSKTRTMIPLSLTSDLYMHVCMSDIMRV